MEWDITKFVTRCSEWRAIQNLRIISATFHLIFLDKGGPQVIETAESQTTDKVELLYLKFLLGLHQFLLGFIVSFVPSAYLYFISFKRLNIHQLPIAFSGSFRKRNSTVLQDSAPTKKIPHAACHLIFKWLF